MGGKNLNPADAYRKEQRKKEIKKSKQKQAAVKEVRDLLNNPDKIEKEIAKAQRASDENRLDKSLKDKVRELKEMKIIADRKQRIKMGGKTPVETNKETSENDTGVQKESGIYGPGGYDAGNMNTRKTADDPLHYAAPPVKRKPEESVYVFVLCVCPPFYFRCRYYHPIYNPFGTPPPGHPPMYKQMPQHQHQRGANSEAVPPPPPPPPPPRPMHVPSNFPGVPPPPRPQQMSNSMSIRPLGGQMGIPPPPPRPPHCGVPPAGLSGQSPHPGQNLYPPSNYVAKGVPYGVQGGHQATCTEPSRSKVIQEPHGAVDPLDPGAEGYTQRFGASARQERKLLRQRQQDEKQEADMKEEREIQERAEKLRESMLASSEDSLLLRKNYEDSKESNVQTQESEPSPPNEHVSTEFKAPMIDPAELMKRRHLVQSDFSGPSEVAMGPAIGPPVSAYQPSSVFGPSLGPANKPVAEGPVLGPTMGPALGPALKEPQIEQSSDPRMASHSPSISSIPSVPKPPTPAIKGPKIVKPDAEVVSLMPTALKKKRQNQSTNSNTALTLKKPRAIDSQNDNKILYSAPKTANTSVDEAYAAFMSEINELGDF